MNRIFRAAELTVAAVALCAALTFAAPASAQDLHVDVARAAPAAQATTLPPSRVKSTIVQAAPVVSVGIPDAPVEAVVPPKPQGYLAQMFNKAVSAINLPALLGRPQSSLDQLVASNEAAFATDREQECLANAVYFESRSESTEGQLAVAQVVLNRASSGRYPTDLCAVITQPAQFSFIRHGRFPRADRDSAAWRKAVAIARIARGRLAATGLPSTCLWYHATYVSPSWGRRLSRQAQIGLHIFYS
jgi:hypothetical protein